MQQYSGIVDSTSETSVQIPELSLTSCVTLGKRLSFSEVKPLGLSEVPSSGIGVNDDCFFVVVVLSIL